MDACKGRGVLAVCVAAVLACAVPAAQAQSPYRCNANGHSYYSDRPCVGPSGKLGVIGPPPEQRPRQVTPHARPLEKAPQHQSYMSAECASLNDAIRTGPTRGLGAATLRDLRQDYSSRCAEDDRQARSRLAQDARQERKEREQQKTAATAARGQALAEQERCGEMKRIIHARRARLGTINDGERADFLRFEGNYEDRCLGG